MVAGAWAVALGLAACGDPEPAGGTAGSSTSAMTPTGGSDGLGTDAGSGGVTTASESDGTDDGPPPMPSQTEACAYWVDCAGVLMLDDATEIEQTYGPDGTCWEAGNAEAAACDVACREALDDTEAELQMQGQMLPEACDLPRMVSWSELQPVLLDNCVAGCHEPGGSDSSLDLSDGAYFALYQVASDQSRLYLVDPGSHEDSYLWHKLAGSQGSVGGGGARMPRDAPPLQAGFIDDVADWIDQGAPNF
ncbi:MAG: hypothetical protein AB1Z98_17975 [Nannocystaceae bacterium]